MKFHPMRAALDDRLKWHGEAVYLRRLTAFTKSIVQCKLPALISAGAPQRLVSDVEQQFWTVIISPTDLQRANWPGGQLPKTQDGVIPPSDPRMPTTNDFVFVRGVQRAIQAVNPIFDQGECIRIDLKVLG